jgi:hypothetical protein
MKRLAEANLALSKRRRQPDRFQRCTICRKYCHLQPGKIVCDQCCSARATGTERDEQQRYSDLEVEDLVQQLDGLHLDHDLIAGKGKAPWVKPGNLFYLTARECVSSHLDEKRTEGATIKAICLHWITATGKFGLVFGVWLSPYYKS